MSLSHKRTGSEETNVVTEARRYGLPSTHTMGSLIPLFLAACHWNGSGVAAIPAGVLSTGALWSGLIAASRLYQGVHSIPDVAAGYVLGAGLVAFWLRFGGRIDAFIAGNQWAWLAIALGAVACIVVYPAPERWTNSYGDTALIVATAAGFLEGCCLAPYWRNGVSLQVLEGVHLLSSGRARDYGWSSLAEDARRCGVGFLVLLPLRFAMKKLSRGAFSALLGASPRWPRSQTNRRHFVDISSKILVYGSLGFSASFLVPLLWLELGMDDHAMR